MTPDASDPPVPPTRHARSFDCEFTGLNASPTTGHDLLDTPEERFAKVHACVRAFTVLQVGVAIFSFDPHTRRWTCRPFNFWTIPDAKAGRGVFSAQVASLQFLVDCGFDLNKCVARGIPFVPAAERSRAAAREARLAQRPPIIPSSDRDKAFVANLLIKVAEWLSRSDDDGDGDGDGARDEDLCLDPTNGFLRALTYQILEGDPSRFGGNKARDDPGFIASTSCDFADGRPRIVLSRASREEVATHRAAKEAADRKKDQMKEGFGLVLAKLGACGRPCVGHNALFDCVYVVDKFLAELDGSFEGFKREFDRTVKGAFYDTKLIAQRFMDGYLDTLQEYGESRPKATRTRRPGSGEGEDAALPGGTSSSRRATDGGGDEGTSSGVRARTISTTGNAAADVETAKETANGDASLARPSPGNLPAPLDTALGPLYRALSSRPLPPMWTEELLRERHGSTRAEAAANAEAEANEPFGGAGTQWRGDGGAILDWIAFPDAFQRYDSALRIVPNRSQRDDVVAAAYGTHKRVSHSFGFEHEAGYDAYMTGVCFIVMVLHSRGVMASSEHGQVRVFADPDAFAGVDAATGLPDRNRIGRLGTCAFSAADGVVPLQRSDMSQMSLRPGTVDVVPDRGNVYFLVGVTQGTTTAAVAQLLAAAGLGIPLHIVFVDKGTVRVIMHGKQYAGNVAHTHYAGAFDGGLRSNRRDPGATVMRDRLRAVGAGVEVLAYTEWVRAKAYERETEASNAAAVAANLAAELAKRTRSTAQISAEVHAGTYYSRSASLSGAGGFLGALLGRSGSKRRREDGGAPAGFPPRKRTRSEYGCVVM